MNSVFVNEVGTPSAPQFWEAILRGKFIVPTQTPITVLNVLHFARVTGPGTMTAANLSALINAAIATDLADAMSDAMSVDTIDVRPMDDPMVAPDINPVAIQGTVATDPQPGFATVTVQKKTFARGRNFRGSMHFAGLAEAHTTGNLLNGTGQTKWQAVVTALLTLCTPFTVGASDECRMVVLSPTLSTFGTNPGVFTGSFIKTDGLTLNTVIGTMRRRKVGVGS